MKSGATLGNIAEMHDDEETSPAQPTVKPQVSDNNGLEASGSVDISDLEADEEEPKPD